MTAPAPFGKRRFTVHEDRVIDQMLRDGWSHPRIAQALGRVSGPSIRAHTAATRDRTEDVRRAPKKKRPCIVRSCGRVFVSTGPGHRMCKDCRRTSENPYEPDA